jgi:hypothetical protein
VPWSRFCTDPWSAAEELHDKGCIKRSKSYLYFHMADQFHCMTTAGGDWAVDFIGRVDEPNEDWAEVRWGGAVVRCEGSLLLSRAAVLGVSRNLCMGKGLRRVDSC